MPWGCRWAEGLLVPSPRLCLKETRCGANEGAFSLGTSRFEHISAYTKAWEMEGVRNARSGQAFGARCTCQGDARDRLCNFLAPFPPSICHEQLLQAAGWFCQQRVMSLSLVGALVCLSIRKSSDTYRSACTTCCGTRSMSVLEVLHGPEPTELCQGGHWPLPFR